MYMLAPLAIALADLTTNVANNAEAEYVHATSYSIGNLVKVTAVASPTPVVATFKVYESLVNSNAGNDPTVLASYTDNWLEVGSINKMAMFDEVESSHTINLDEIDVTLTTGEQVTALFLKGLAGYQVEVTMTSVADGLVYEETFNLVDEGFIIDEWAWCFEEIVRTDQVTVSDLPAYTDAPIRIVITNDSGEDAECGICAIGFPVQFGDAQHGLEFGILDYSEKTVDALTGKVSLTPGAFAETARFIVHADEQSAGAIKRALTSRRALATGFVVSEELDGAAIWGFPREWRVIYSEANHTIIEFYLEGISQ